MCACGNVELVWNGLCLYVFRRIVQLNTKFTRKFRCKYNLPTKHTMDKANSIRRTMFFPLLIPQINSILACSHESRYFCTNSIGFIALIFHFHFHSRARSYAEREFATDAAKVLCNMSVLVAVDYRNGCIRIKTPREREKNVCFNWEM